VLRVALALMRLLAVVGPVTVGFGAMRLVAVVLLPVAAVAALTLTLGLVLAATVAALAVL
jgi:hypothetical protein